MKKKLLTVLLATAVVGMYSFGSAASAFADDANTSGEASPVQVEEPYSSSDTVTPAADSDTAASAVNDSTVTTPADDQQSGDTDTTASAAKSSTPETSASDSANTETPAKEDTPTTDTSVANVSTQAELQAALANAAVKTINVTTDIEIDATLRISHDVAISGAKLIRKAGFTDTMIYVSLNKSLTLSNITVDGNKANVSAQAALITVWGSLKLDTVSLINNKNCSTTIQGGAITSFGTVDMSGSTITGNETSCDGGGIWNYTSHKLTIKDSTIDSNISGRSGGAVFSSGSHEVEITDSSICSNQSLSSGGGIDSYGILTMSGCTVKNNSISRGAGAGITNQSQATMTLTNVTVENNTASGFALEGGGIANFGKMTMTGGSISNNKAQNSANTALGGGLYNYQDSINPGNSPGNCVITGTKIDGNSAAIGGGIYNAGSLDINCEINNNAASTYGGGIYNLYYTNNGYGIINMTGGTIANNSALCGGGIYNYGVCSVLGGTISGNTITSDDKLNGSAIYLVRDVTLAPAATIEGDCFIYFDHYSNLLLTGSFKDHKTISISVPAKNYETTEQPQVIKGYQVVKPAGEYALTSDDMAAFTCIGNGKWSLHIVDQNADKDYAEKSGTIVLWDAPADPIIIPVTPVDPVQPIVDPGDNNNTDDPTNPTEPTKPDQPIVDPGDNSNTGEPTTPATVKDTTENNNADQPKTGDQNDTAPWAVVLIAGAAMSAVILKKRTDK